MNRMQQKVMAALVKYGPDAAKIAAVTGLSVASVQSALAVTDYTALTAAADFSGLGLAVVGVIIALIGASLLVAGAQAFWKIVKQGRSV